MKYTPPLKTLFIRNRRNFSARMKPGTAAVFFSNDLHNTNADAHYAFEQDSNMYWLTGIDQEECALVLFPDAPKPEWREVLFIRQTNEKIQVWEGWKYSKEEAAEASGVTVIKFQEELDAHVRNVLAFCEGLYLDFNEYERNTLFTPGPSHRFYRRVTEEWPGFPVLRAAPVLRDLRMIKSEEEILQMRIACSITEKAFRRVMQFTRPGVWEYEIEAEVMHAFILNRATRPAYGTIIASGKNACVLHYVLNNQQCRDGDLVLMDFGAEYGNYSADLTRTIPVNGKFTKRQREVYDACLRVFRFAKDRIVTGTLLEDYHKQVGECMTEELLKLGLLKKEEVEKQNPEWPAYKKYFMHGTSHFLGLDTHDVGHRYTPFQPGMVLTCEPGIYIPEEGIGIRIENDILVTEHGNEDLMATIPIEAEAIEAEMG